MAQQTNKDLWVVVKVESGIPVIVEAYLKKKDALKRENFFRKNMNLDNDETGVFQIATPFSKIASQYQ